MNITWVLTPQEAQYIGNVLAAQPFKDVAALLAKLNQQSQPPQKETASDSEALRSR